MIELPKPGELYTGASVLLFRGSAAKSIKPRSFSWTVNFFRNGVDEGVVKRVKGRRSGGLFIRRANAAAGDFYQINLTVTDGVGNATTLTRDVLPRLKHSLSSTGL